MTEQSLLKQAFQVTLGPAPCAVDIGDGSERSEYVNQDYLLRTLDRPHRSVNLMYCYYPKDKGWPLRASVAHSASAKFAWAYPYDDYFPYQGGSKGNTKGEPFQQIRDIRRHGQDVTLTLTIDCSLKNAQLKVIAQELKPFGRLRLRINHECDGNWFAFNKRYNRTQVSDFFIRFHEIIKSIAPNIQTICCFGSLDKETGRLAHEDELVPMLSYADIWSIDKYLSLHYKWPYNLWKENQLKQTYTYEGVDYVWKAMHKIYEIFMERSGQQKPLEICEFNFDGDVGGRALQVKELKRFYNKVLKKKPYFLQGITYYQFRDRGRLGLEQEDPNNPDVGIPAPFLDDYRKIIREPYFCPTEFRDPLPANEPLLLNWRNSEDAQGVGWQVPLKSTPSFFELKFNKKLNLIIKIGNEWHYKKPGVEWVDVTETASKSTKGDTVSIAAFSPPSDGTNPRSGSGYRSVVTSKLNRPPELRILY